MPVHRFYVGSEFSMKTPRTRMMSEFTELKKKVPYRTEDIGPLHFLHAELLSYGSISSCFTILQYRYF